MGTHLIRFLNSDTAKISVIASGDSKSRQEPEPGVEYYDLDIRNAADVQQAVREISPDQIYHLAGVSAVDVSWKTPRLTFEVNVLGTYNLFEAGMSLPSPPRILNVSTSQVYAASNEILTETSQLGPDNPYAASKAMAELLQVQYRKSMDGGIVTARSFNHTGPGQTTNFVLPSIAKQFAEMEAGLRAPSLTVGNIEVKRDFTDVRDVVRAYSALMEKGRAGEVYNVCSGSAVRLVDCIRKFESIAGFSIQINTDPERVRSNEVSQIRGDCTKIRSETGWCPQIPLEKTIQDLFDYWRNKIKSEVPTEAE